MARWIVPVLVRTLTGYTSKRPLEWQNLLLLEDDDRAYGEVVERFSSAAPVLQGG